MSGSEIASKSKSGSENEGEIGSVAESGTEWVGWE